MKKGLLILTIINSINLFGQKTIKYQGVLKSMFLIETIELYDDNTFKWSNEYDLSWNEYGLYEIKNKQLVLDYYIFNDYPKKMSLKDSIKTVKVKLNTRIFDIEEERIYPLNNKGRRVKKMKNCYFRTRWSWLFGCRYKYEVIKVEN